MRRRCRQWHSSRDSRVPSAPPPRPRAPALSFLGRYEHAHACLVRTLRLLPEPASVERAELLIELTLNEFYRSRYEAMRDWAAPALSAAKETRDAALIAAAAVMPAFADAIIGPTEAARSEFSGLAAGKPSIYPIYWSGPQMQAREDASMVAAHRFLNGFWQHESEGRTWFDPSRDTAYPDRIRRSAPGTTSKGLSPHTDAGSLERWLLTAYHQVFRHVFDGNPSAYDPWDGAYRTDVYEYRSPVMCSVFRTFQGWTALRPWPAPRASQRTAYPARHGLSPAARVAGRRRG